MILRILYLALIVTPFTLIGLPIQLVLARTPSRVRAVLPRTFFKLLAFGLGLKITIHGNPAAGPVLLVSNHISWLDIVAIGAVVPVRFVAKSDVARYPLVGVLARLQRTIFIDRTRHTDAGRAAREMGAALGAGERVLLFPEGTSDIGTHVLPFKSALMGTAGNAAVQPMAIAYTAISGLPLSRHERPNIAWVGDMGLDDNLWQILSSGTKSVSIAFGIPIAPGADRKALAAKAETEVRKLLVALNRREALPSDGVLM